MENEQKDQSQSLSGEVPISSQGELSLSKPIKDTKKNTSVVYNSLSGGTNKRISLIVGVITVLLLLGGIIGGYFFWGSRTPEKVTLLYWGTWEDPAVFSTVLEEFHKKYPYINVKYEKQDPEGLGKYVERLRTRISSQEKDIIAPDVFSFHNSWTPFIVDILEPFPTNVVSKTQVSTAYFPVVSTDLKQKGAFYGLPLYIDTLVLFANTSIFSESDITENPQVWDDVISYARQTTKLGDQDTIVRGGVSLGTYDNIRYASDIMSFLFYQNGADLADLLGSKRKFAEDALDFYTAFARGTKEEKVWDNSLDNSLLAFSKGNLAMYFGYSFDIQELKTKNPNLSFTVLPVPYIAGKELSKRSVASFFAEGVSTNSPHKKEAFLLLSYLSEKETLKKLFDAQQKHYFTARTYPRKDMAPMLKENPVLQVVVQQADTAVSTPFSGNTYDDDKIAVLDSYMGNAIRSVNAGVLPSTAIETLSQGINQVYGNIPQQR